MGERIVMRSPNWNEEELKMALELYLSKDLEWLAKMKDTTQEIQLLSQLLNGMDFFGYPKPDNFRSCSSVRMKLSNFKALDRRYGKLSLSNVGTKDKEVWNKYHNNYEILKGECKKIVDKHFQGSKTSLLDDYISRYVEIAVDFDILGEFKTFANNTYKMASHYREKAIKEVDLELSQRMINTCYEIMKALVWCNALENGTVMPNRENEIHREHGGINLMPMKKREEKIGKYVQSTIESLISNDMITEQIINNLTDAEWTRQHLHLGHPLLLLINQKEKLSKQLQDQNGHLRYWKKVYTINGQKYCICKEWFESGRKYFEEWVKSVKRIQTLGVKLEILQNILLFIKESDEKFISIKRDDLYEVMDGVDNKEILLGKFVEIGLLTAFQGSESELVVDDYELLFDMINHPKCYI